MSKQYKDVIRIFFSDYLCWLVSISVLFVISLVAAIAFVNANGFIWIIPISFLVIYCSSFPLFILYCKARKDLKYNNIDKLAIRILKIEQDDKLVFRNRGGAIAGKRKYRIIDENGDYYLLSTANDKGMFILYNPDFTFSLEVEVLKKSRLVLRMKLIDEPKVKKETKNQKYSIKLFSDIFGHYL
ncbi:MAG: hypothetical protein ACI3XI_04725 [Eubacteriales bacterium]